MRAAIVLGLVVVLFPAVAGAQSDGSKEAGSGRNVTKEQYMEQAKQRFDKLDTNHDGILSSDELKTGRRKKSSQE
jgi:Ca2+-binding EF-hand superfamily protein